MSAALAIFVFDLALSAAFAGTAWVLVYRLVPADKQERSVPWLFSWWMKGLLLPVLLWSVMNLGVSWSLQPFMPVIQAAQNGKGPWVPVFLKVVATGMIIVSSYWAAVTLAWALPQSISGIEGEARSDFKAMAWTAGIGMGIVGLLLLAVGGLGAAGAAVTVVLAPIAAYTPGIAFARKPRPVYSRAIGKIKLGKYSEAEWEIIRQLEDKEDDVEGWMMLAELYAEHFKDLDEAEQIILELCDQPQVIAPQVALALHKLADWHLKHGKDPERARRALQIICDRMPGTHLAHMAGLRMRQLPSVEDLRAQQPQTIPLPALGDHFSDAPKPADRLQAAAMAKACVSKLNEDANDVPAREKLARLLADDLGQPDKGIEQLTLLLDMPDQPHSKRADWLSLIAAWHLKYRQDIKTGRRMLERLIREFPHTPQALAAKRRLQLVERGN